MLAIFIEGRHPAVEGNSLRTEYELGTRQSNSEHPVSGHVKGTESAAGGIRARSPAQGHPARDPAEHTAARSDEAKLEITGVSDDAKRAHRAGLDAPQSETATSGFSGLDR